MSRTAIDVLLETHQARIRELRSLIVAGLGDDLPRDGASFAEMAEAIRLVRQERDRLAAEGRDVLAFLERQVIRYQSLGEAEVMAELSMIKEAIVAGRHRQ